MEDGSKALELTSVDVVRFSSLEMVPDVFHNSSREFWGAVHLPSEDDLRDYLHHQTPRACRECQPGQLVHFYARNSSGQICGLLEFDQGESPPSDFEALVLFDDSDIVSWNPLPALEPVAD